MSIPGLAADAVRVGAREGLMMPVLARNASLDALFYDVAELAPQELLRLAAFDAAPGSVLLVRPKAKATGEAPAIVLYPDAAALLADWEDRLGGIAIGGVGSSVTGTAALARNLAETKGVPVAGLVGSYGPADLAGEAAGGWLVMGAADRLGVLVEGLRRRLGRPRSEGTGPDGLFPTPQSAALHALLVAQPKKLTWLVGHSKGAFVIANALEVVARADRRLAASLGAHLRVVTFGGVVGLPSLFPLRHQFIGDLDAYGRLNSTRRAEALTVRFAGHHTNRRIPFHLSVPKLLDVVP